MNNPFRSAIVSNPWHSNVPDVPSIHNYAFLYCCEAMATVRSTRQSTSVLIAGEAGSGKTHLLSRLCDHIAKEAETDGPGGLQEAIFISVRLDAGASMIWRHLQTRTAGDLLINSAQKSSQLERALLHHVEKQRLIGGDVRLWLENRRRELRATNARFPELEKMFEDVDPLGSISPNLRTILGHLLLARHRSDSAAWLRGNSLSESALQRLGLGNEVSDDGEQEYHARQIVLGLCQLASTELPFVFCFDQIEALQIHPEDTTGLFAFGQLVRSLHDQTDNVLLISCIQSSFYSKLKDSVDQAAWAGLTAFGQTSLYPLTWEQAERLIQIRLDTNEELARQRAQINDLYWPLKREDIQTVYPAIGCTPRQLIAHCAELFEANQKGKGVDLPPIEQFLAQSLEERSRKSRESIDPSKIDQILSHGLPSLIHLLRKDLRQNDHQIPQGVDLLFEGPEGRIAFSFCNSSHYPSLVRKLDRLMGQLNEKQFDRLILLRDGSQPISATASTTRAKREELIKRGASWVETSAEAVAALDALRSLLSDAKSGELDNRGETIGWKTVQDWLISNLTSELKDLLDEILPPDPNPTPSSSLLPLLEDISEFLQHHHVVSITDLSAHLSKEKREIESCVEQHSDRIGVLGEPPTVLFRLVAESFAA